MSGFRRRLLMNSGNPFDVNPSKSVAGDFAFYDKTLEKIVIISYDTVNSDTFNKSNYTPIGIVVVPGKHNIYKDGSCAIMALKYASSSDSSGYTWTYADLYAGFAEDVNEIKNLYEFPIVNNNSSIEDRVINTSDNSWFPSDSITNDSYGSISNPYDLKTRYAVGLNYSLSPSPYKNNDEYNNIYNIPNTIYDKWCTEDINGYENTNNIVKYHRQTNWQFDSETIKNENIQNCYPAACCAYKYNINRIKRYEWYLPSMGELGYLIARLATIEKSMIKCHSLYSNVMHYITDTKYWSSTRANDRFIIIQINGHAESGGYSSAACIPFLKIK